MRLELRIAGTCGHAAKYCRWFTGIHPSKQEELPRPANLAGGWADAPAT